MTRLLTQEELQLNDIEAVPFLEAHAEKSGAAPSVKLASVDVMPASDIHKEPAWADAFTGHYKDRRYYEIVHETLHPEIDYRYFVLRSASGDAVATQPFFLIDQDLLTGTKGWPLTIVNTFRKRWQKFLYMRTLFVGCVAGEGHLDDRAGVLNGEAMHLLARAALKVAREERAGLIVFKEFPEKYRPVTRSLKSAGLIHLPSLPMASVSIDYKDFDDYLSRALSKGTRKDLRRKFRAAEKAQLVMDVVTDIGPHVDEIYPLYLNVYNRSSLHFEKLTKEYLRALGERMPETTRYFIWRMDGRIVAFNLCMVHGENIYDQYIGLDYSVALDLHLYHYTFKDIVSWGIQNGYKRYVSNALNYDPKYHLRMKLDPLDLYVRHRNGAANAVMKLVLPWLEPTQYDKNLKRFANFDDLWHD
jgi:hypothetical protein